MQIKWTTQICSQKVWDSFNRQRQWLTINLGFHVDHHELGFVRVRDRNVARTIVVPGAVLVQHVEFHAPTSVCAFARHLGHAITHTQPFFCSSGWHFYRVMLLHSAHCGRWVQCVYIFLEILEILIYTRTQLFYCSSGICPGTPGSAGTSKR